MMLIHGAHMQELRRPNVRHATGRKILLNRMYIRLAKFSARDSISLDLLDFSFEIRLQIYLSKHISH